MSGCLFCNIVARTSPAIIVYENDRVLAFLDIRPIMPGHTLVVPKEHAATLDDLVPDLAAEVFQVGQRLARAMRRSELGAHGAHLTLNDGRAAFQTVHHSHLHVIPRRERDIVRFGVGLVTRRATRREQVGQAIRDGLRRLDQEDVK